MKKSVIKDDKKKKKSSTEQLNADSAVAAASLKEKKAYYLTNRSLDSLNAQLEDLKKKMELVNSQNKEVAEAARQQEQDNLEIIRFLQADNDSKDHKIVELERKLEELKVLGEQDREKLNRLVEDKVAELKNTIHEKDIAFLALQGEILQMKDFKKKRHEMTLEIEKLKQELLDTEERHRQVMNSMEKKFIEEKIRLQREADEKIASLALVAHKTAIDNVTDTTREVFKENIKMVEALRYHIYESELLSKHNTSLISDMQKANQEKELGDALVREKIFETKQLEQQIKELSLKNEESEKCITDTVKKYEQEKKELVDIVRVELENVKDYAQSLKDHLIRKSTEIKYIKKLALHILAQRSDVEKFFIESLESVKSELATEQQQKEREAFEAYGRRLNGAIESKGLSLPMLATLKPGLSPELGKFLEQSKFKKSLTSVSIEDLGWKDKERVLRLLFSKMQ